MCKQLCFAVTRLGKIKTHKNAHATGGSVLKTNDCTKKNKIMKVLFPSHWQTNTQLVQINIQRLRVQCEGISCLHFTENFIIFLSLELTTGGSAILTFPEWEIRLNHFPTLNFKKCFLFIYLHHGPWRAWGELPLKAMKLTHSFSSHSHDNTNTPDNWTDHWPYNKFNLISI